MNTLKIKTIKPHVLGDINKRWTKCYDRQMIAPDRVEEEFEAAEVKCGVFA